MTAGYFTNPQDKLFSERVNPLRYTQTCKCSFTRDYGTFGPKPMLVHVQSDDSYFGIPCDGCGKDYRVLWKVRDRHCMRARLLCAECMERGKPN